MRWVLVQRGGCCPGAVHFELLDTVLRDSHGQAAAASVSVVFPGKLGPAGRGDPCSWAAQDKQLVCWRDKKQGSAGHASPLRRPTVPSRLPVLRQSPALSDVQCVSSPQQTPCLLLPACLQTAPVK
jgi:hypothetical protein